MATIYYTLSVLTSFLAIIAAFTNFTLTEIALIVIGSILMVISGTLYRIYDTIRGKGK